MSEEKPAEALPGPWKWIEARTHFVLVGQGNTETAPTILDAQDGLVVVRDSDGALTPVHPANPNASLIAMAPTLLERVRSLERKCSELHEFFRAHVVLVSAMRKAQRLVALPVDRTMSEKEIVLRELARLLETLVDGSSSDVRLERYFRGE